MREAVIVSAARTPVGKAGKGTLRNVRPELLGALVVKEVVKRASPVDPADIDDVILGCAFPEGEAGMNVARVIALKAGLPISVSGLTVNRFCSSGLQTIALAAQNIMCGFSDVIIAGGVETMSMVPMGGNKPAPDPEMMDTAPEVYTPMGITAELVAERYNVSRQVQDAFALRSQQRALAALKEGTFKEQYVPVPYRDADGTTKMHEVDEGPRETTPESLAALRPAFRATGSVTAGNSSQMNDAAAAVMVMSAEKAKSLGLKPMAYFRNFQVVGVPPEIMGVGPAYAIPKLLKATGLKVQDIDLWEINEAFAAQAVYCVRELGIPEERVNVNGGAIALGHPLGCTGAKLTVQLMYEMKRRNARYGVVSMCIGGGMGAAGLFERC